MPSCTLAPKLRFYNYAPAATSIQERILRGLKQPEKQLPSFLLYDARGIRLFDRLSKAGDYTAARHESRLLAQCGQELRRLAGSRATVVEYGSGAARTAVVLLRSLKTVAGYVPVDLSLASLKFGVHRVQRASRGLEIAPVRADFTSCFPMPPLARSSARTLVYVSSCTMSALDFAAATRLVQGAIKLGGQRGAVLLGVGLRGPLAEGDPRAFNLNVLRHVNRRFAANFRQERFASALVYDADRGRSELRLLSQMEQTIKIDQAKVRLRRGDSILTEARRQYGWDEIKALADDAGGHVERVWISDERAVALCLLRPAR
ncbi:MAG TPA: L-histidine N(alpha)-methyltransferase [Pirellulales bacterium]|nr:L-histidine N(alpha)-methyltransferase [Pirellulales bacterium]